jgi:Na+/H+ antiporter NhaA
MLRQNFIKYFLLGLVRFRNVELLIIPFARATRLLVVAIVLGVVVAEEAGVLSVSKILLETTFGFGVDVAPSAQERE